MSQHQAACATADPELFFPVGTSGPALIQIAEARAICHHCPIAADCLTDGLAHPHDGVQAAMTADERTALLRGTLTH